VSNRSVVVVDTNFFSRLKKVDGDCGSVEFVIFCFGPSAIADLNQLKKMPHCQNINVFFTDHGISDEKVMTWINSHSDQGIVARLRKHAVSDDLVDIKLLQYAKGTDASTLLTNDKWVLFMANDMHVQHFCFKAAFSETDTCMDGGLSDGHDYSTEQMKEPRKKFKNDPFFHYGCDTHCPQCDPNNLCGHRRG